MKAERGFPLRLILDCWGVFLWIYHCVFECREKIKLLTFMNKRVPQLQILKKNMENKGLVRLNELDFIVKDALVARFHHMSILSKEINSCELLTSVTLQFGVHPSGWHLTVGGGRHRVAVHLGFYLQDLVSDRQKKTENGRAKRKKLWPEVLGSIPKWPRASTTSLPGVTAGRVRGEDF